MENSLKKLLSRRPLLVICGPTATGKTALALRLAKIFNGEIISADSRQVYKYMDIGTGKDNPEGVTIWGYDLVEPSEDFSVSQYTDFAKAKIDEIWKEGKLPIIVGGTGLYIKAVVDGIGTLHIPPNQELRDKLKSKSAFELFNMLAKVDPGKAQKMNISDKNNPRRLIRAIEIASEIRPDKIIDGDDTLAEGVLFIGLSAKSETIKENISKRVKDRIKQGMENEVVSLLRKKIDWNSQALSSLGYKLWRDYLEGKYSLEDLQKMWIEDEFRYAKRQITWFKNDSRIQWFDIEEKDWLGKVERLVQIWHNNHSNANSSKS